MKTAAKEKSGRRGFRARLSTSGDRTKYRPTYFRSPTDTPSGSDTYRHVRDADTGRCSGGSTPPGRRGNVFTCRCSLLASCLRLAGLQASERPSCTPVSPVTVSGLSRMENRGTVADAPMLFASVHGEHTSCKMHGCESRVRQMTLLFRPGRYAKCTATSRDQSPRRDYSWKLGLWGLCGFFDLVCMLTRTSLSPVLLRVHWREKYPRDKIYFFSGWIIKVVICIDTKILLKEGEMHVFLETFRRGDCSRWIKIFGFEHITDTSRMNIFYFLEPFSSKRTEGKVGLTKSLVKYERTRNLVQAVRILFDLTWFLVNPHSRKLWLTRDLLLTWIKFWQFPPCLTNFTKLIQPNCFPIFICESRMCAYKGICCKNGQYRKACIYHIICPEEQIASRPSVL